MLEIIKIFFNIVTALFAVMLTIAYPIYMLLLALGMGLFVGYQVLKSNSKY